MSYSTTASPTLQVRNDPLKQSIRYLKGVGPKRSLLLSRVEVETVRDLFYYLPRRYEDRSHFKVIRELAIGNSQTVFGTILALGERKTRKGHSLFEVIVSDQTGILQAIWFNQPYLANLFRKGQKVILYGKVDFFQRLQMNQPEFEILDEEDQENLSLHLGRLVPIYPLTADLTQRWLRTAVHEALKRFSPWVVDFLPTSLRSRHELPPLGETFSEIHFPTSLEKAERARQRLAFDEFLMLGLGLASRRRQIKTTPKPFQIDPDSFSIGFFEKQFSFRLTNAQRRVLKEIQDDMVHPEPMNRLLQGDVGSGKTLIALYAILLAVRSSTQAAFMVPTEILAEQQAATLTRFFHPMNIRVGLLAALVKGPSRQRLMREVAKGTVQVVVGTHALIQEGVHFKHLGLAVVDEQHKFGVLQRTKLRQKGLTPDVLVMTATPIPRTLALTLYGDLDVSILDELPPGRKPVETHWREEKDRTLLYEEVRTHLKKGEQGYVVCPFIEESEKQDLRAAKRVVEELRELFSEFRVGLLHGRMKPEEKGEGISAFRRGELQVLVSTIVVEVGIDIPSASWMVIEHGERFGLSQLHQLRGRIGRGTQKAICWILADPKTEETQTRLEVFCKTHDGFLIAEEDLALRGPGEFFGKRQHGLPEIKIGDIVRDLALLQRAREEAYQLLQQDPLLEKPEHRRLGRQFLETCGGKLDFIQTG